jgi:hypothetical protein
VLTLSGQGRLFSAIMKLKEYMLEAQGRDGQTNSESRNASSSSSPDLYPEAEEEEEEEEEEEKEHGSQVGTH